MKIPPFFKRVAVLLSVVLAPGRSAAASAPVTHLEAPPLGLTHSSVLLLWEAPAEGQSFTYEILREGKVVAMTRQRSLTLTGLQPDTAYQVEVQARRSPRENAGAKTGIEIRTRAITQMLDVRQFGAKGDGRHDDTAGLQAAIAACEPGGIVRVPAGIYRSGQIELKSNLTLQLEAGALLRFLGKRESRYVEHDVALPGPQGEVVVRSAALISGRRVENVTIMGEGTIDANGPTWWPEPTEMRPRTLELILGRNIHIQGITIKDPPYWNTRLLNIDDAVVNGVTFLKESVAHGTNGDGLVLDSAQRVLVAGCLFGNQDDSLVLKSGKATAEADRPQRPCEDIQIRDCRFDGLHAPGSHPLGFAIGSEASGGVRRVRLRDCEFVDAASVANIKVNRDRRFALVEDIRIENCTYANTEFGDEPWNHGPISLDLFYYNRSEDPAVAQPLTAATPRFRDIHFRNITIANAKGRAIYLSGLAEQPIENVTFTHVTAVARRGLFARNAHGVILDDVSITPAEGAPTEWINVQDHREISAGSKTEKAR